MNYKLLTAVLFGVAMVVALLWPNVTVQAYDRPTTVRQMVEFAFPDAPVMVRIAEAESRFDPSAKNPNSSAQGIFQILSGTWISNDCVGDRLSASDNIACAKILYEKYGTSPWNASKGVWGKKGLP